MLDSAELELVVEIAGVMLSPSEPVVEVVRTGSTEGPWVGAPEKVGSGWGVANICPSGPRIRRAESCTFPSSSANSGPVTSSYCVHSPAAPSLGPLNVTPKQAPGVFARL